jgi:hypothetical protein
VTLVSKKNAQVWLKVDDDESVEMEKNMHKKNVQVCEDGVP